MTFRFSINLGYKALNSTFKILKLMTFNFELADKFKVH